MPTARWFPTIATALIATALIATAVGTSAAFAQEPEKPLAEKDVTATDVAATPITDLNIRKDEIPALLIAAQEQPYSLAGLGRCSQIAAAVGEFDAVLGDDIDLPQGQTRRTSAGRVAKSVVGAFIPFRGVIREISGANKQERLFQAAIQAGVARRSFLKGVGTARGCRYPARAATAEVFAQRVADLNGETRPPAAAAADAPDARPAATSYRSQPVVQQITDRR